MKSVSQKPLPPTLTNRKGGPGVNELVRLVNVHITLVRPGVGGVRVGVGGAQHSGPQHGRDVSVGAVDPGHEGQRHGHEGP